MQTAKRKNQGVGTCSLRQTRRVCAILAALAGAMPALADQIDLDAAGLPVDIPDFPDAGAQADISAPSVGDTEVVTSISIVTQYSLTLNSNVEITLQPPPGTGVSLITLTTGVMATGTYLSAWNPTNTPALEPILGSDVGGLWTLVITDTTDDGGPGTVVGELEQFSISYDLEEDCNQNGVADPLDIAGGTSFDVDGNGVPDECSMLIGHWSLDEGSGTAAADSSGNMLDGTLIGGVQWTTGQFGSAAMFDLNPTRGVPVSAEHILIGHDSLLDFTEAFSVSFWINGPPNQDGNGNGRATIIDKSHGGGDNLGWAVQAHAADGASIAMAVGTGTGFPEPRIAGVLDNTWHHVAIAVSKEPTLRIRGYVDGALVTDFTDPATTIAPNSRDLLFGAWYGAGSPQRQFVGMLDEVRIYNGKLTDCEISALSNPAGFANCNTNNVPDTCELPGNDCNSNGALDTCDIGVGTSEDCNSDGIPDECLFPDGTDGIDPSTEHRIFVTSGQYDGNLGGVSGADAKCEAAAFAAGLSLTYKAIISDSTENAVDRITLNGGAIKTFNGVSPVIVASDGDLFDGDNLSDPIQYDENGTDLFTLEPGALSWTGSTNLGVASAQHCLDWSDDDQFSVGTMGQVNTVTLAWLSNGSIQCSTIRHLYCISQSAASQDCNTNQIPDECELAGNDCNSNGIPDDCESLADCNSNGALDICDIAAGTSADCNANDVPDECESILYVDDSAISGLNNGTSWADAYLDLQDALSAAVCVTSEIRVAQGTYYPSMRTNPADPQTATFTLIDGVSILGGFAGVEAPDPDQRDVNSNATILSGDIDQNDNNSNGITELPSMGNNAYHVVTGSGISSNGVIDGCTITGGHTNQAAGVFTDRDGGGMLIISGSPTISACRFAGNSATEGFGGGLYMLSSAPTISGCTFDKNGTGLRGGGIYNDVSSPTISGCSFRINSAAVFGAGIFNHGGSPTVRQCVFEGHTTGIGGGGMANEGGGTPLVEDCMFVDNSGSVQAGAIWNTGGAHPTIRGCEFIDNRGGEYGGAIVTDNAQVTISDSRFENNVVTGAGPFTPRGGAIANLLSTATVTSCWFAGNSSPLDDGGAVYDDQSTSTYDGCTFIANTAAANGGAARQEGGSVAFWDCTFTANDAGVNGGGVHGQNSDLVVVDSRFIGNTTVNQGPGISFVGTPATSPLVLNSIFAGNSGVDNGGVFFAGPSSPVVANCAFVGNTDSSGGGGGAAVRSQLTGNPRLSGCTLAANGSAAGGAVFLDNGQMQVQNSILWGNTPAQLAGPGAANVAYSDIDGGFAGSHNISADPEFVGGPGGTWTDDAQYDAASGLSTLVDSNGSFAADELVGKFLNPDTTGFSQTLITSNGPTTIVAWGDFTAEGTTGAAYRINNYRIRSNSPVVDAGLNVLIPADTLDLNTNGNTTELVPFDLDGNPRIFNLRVDMGAFESQVLDCNTNGVADALDLAGATSVDCNSNGVPDECELFLGDCNTNGVPDACDIEAGTSEDCNSDAIPDECLFSDGTDGIDPSTEHRVFVTSSTYDGAMGGVLGADARCAEAASAAGLLLTYKAIISDSTENAVDRITLNGGAIKTFNAGSPVVVAADGDLFDGDNLDSPIFFHENGTPSPGGSAWTGSFADGTAQVSLHCANWTVSDFSGGKPGEIAQVSSSWLESPANSVCINTYRLYCISQSAASQDCNANQIPDECETVDNDCNSNGTLDECEVAGGDCDSNGELDTCEIAADPGLDINTNGILDACEEPVCLIISEIMDGTLTGGTPKYVEITNTGLTDFTFTEGGLIIQSNLSNDLTIDVDLNGVTVAAGASFLMVSDNQGGDAAFVSVFGFAADLVSSFGFGNGNDRYILTSTTDSSVILDSYGVDGVDGTGTVWEYTDSYAYRLSAFASGKGLAFDPAEWDIAPPGTLTDVGEAGIAAAGTPGAHSVTATCETCANVLGIALDLDDFDLMEPCLLGPVGGIGGPVCDCFDFDGSGTVDLLDFAEVQIEIAGN